MKVLSLQGDYHSHDSDIFPMLEEYCKVRCRACYYFCHTVPCTILRLACCHFGSLEHDDPLA